MKFGLEGVLQVFFPLFGSLVMLILPMSFLAIRSLRDSGKVFSLPWGGLFIVWFTPIIVLVGIAHFINFQILGRHLSLVFFAFTMAMWCFFLRGKTNFWTYVFAVFVLVIQLSSSINLLTKEKYARDDYKNTVSLLIEVTMANKSVIYSGPIGTLTYCIRHLGYEEHENEILQNVVLAFNTPDNNKQRLEWEKASAVFRTKEIYFDKYGTLLRFLSERKILSSYSGPRF